jgi:hypothetical protein
MLDGVVRAIGAGFANKADRFDGVGLTNGMGVGANAAGAA